MICAQTAMCRTAMLLDGLGEPGFTGVAPVTTAAAPRCVRRLPRSQQRDSRLRRRGAPRVRGRSGRQNRQLHVSNHAWSNLRWNGGLVGVTSVGAPLSARRHAPPALRSSIPLRRNQLVVLPIALADDLCQVGSSDARALSVCRQSSPADHARTSAPTVTSCVRATYRGNEWSRLSPRTVAGATPTVAGL